MYVHWKMPVIKKNYLYISILIYIIFFIIAAIAGSTAAAKTASVTEATASDTGKKIIIFQKKTISISFFVKVEKVLKGSLDWIPSPSPSVKIQIINGKVYSR